MEDVRREVLADALEFLQGFVADLGHDDPVVRRELGLAYQQMAAIHTLLGRFEPARAEFRQALGVLAERDITPGQVLHVGSRIAQDIVPARKLGMRTALFAGDKASLQATPEQLKEAASRPDVLLTELSQIAEVVR